MYQHARCHGNGWSSSPGSKTTPGYANIFSPATLLQLLFVSANHTTRGTKLFTVFCFPPGAPHDRGYQQQDAHEFMRYLLDKLHTELAQALQTRTSEQAKNTIVSDIFGGVLQSDVSCQNIGHVG